MQRRIVDTAQQSDRRLWEDLAARAVSVSVPYRPAPGMAVYHIRVDDYVVMAAEDDLAGPLLDLVTAVMALGSEMLGREPCPMSYGLRRAGAEDAADTSSHAGARPALCLR
jgi:hypothetical protein